MILVRYEHHNKSRIKLNHKTLAELFTRVSFTEFISNVYHSKFNLGHFKYIFFVDSIYSKYQKRFSK